nr:spore germination protein GerW family protein [Rhabdothermincola salaria]
MQGAQRSTDVRRVFGDAIERDGVTVIPVAQLRGAGGGGGGTDADTDAAGSGGGYAITARPVGVLVIRDGQVEWQPTRDPDRLALAGLATFALVLLVVRGALRRGRS